MGENKSYFETRFCFDAQRELVWKQIVKYLQRYIPLYAKVLDIGAGYHNFINNIKAQEKHALDISDISKDSVNKDVNFYLDSACEMKCIKSSYFDFIFASNLLKHLSCEELKATLFQVKRVLKNKGRFIILQPNFRYCYKVYFDDYSHKQVFTHLSLSNLLEENGFRVIKVLPRFIPFSMKSQLPKVGFLVWLYLRIPFKPFGGQMLILAEKQ